MAKKRVTEKMIETASEIYANHRSPYRWDGVTWGECGRSNHKKAIKHVLEYAMRLQKESENEM